MPTTLPRTQIETWAGNDSVNRQGFNDNWQALEDRVSTLDDHKDFMSTAGVITGGDVAAQNPATLSVDVAALLGRDPSWHRIYTSGTTAVDCSVDYLGASTAVAGAGNEKWLLLAALYNATTGGVTFRVIQGTEAPSGTASKPSIPSDAICLADIRRYYGDGSIGSGQINTDRRMYYLASFPRLAGATVVGDILPDANGTRALGSADKRWDGYFDMMDVGGVIQSFFAADTVTDIFQVKLQGDSNNRFKMQSGGGLWWGSGAATMDTNLYRSAADTLKTDDSLVVVGNLTVNGTGTSTFAGPLTVTGDVQATKFLTTIVESSNYWIRSATAHSTLGWLGLWWDNTNQRWQWLVGGAAISTLTKDGNTTIAGTLAVNGTGTSVFAGGVKLNDTYCHSERAVAGSYGFMTRIAGDTNYRFVAYSDGKLVWGPGNASPDTNLYRSAADTLQTDDAFVVNGTLTVGGVNVGPFSAGDRLLAKADTERQDNSYAWVKKKEIQVNRAGTLRIKFDLRTNSGTQTAKGRVYRNGVAVGTERTTSSTTYVTFTEDISGWSAGDLVQLYIDLDGAGGADVYTRNFQIYVATSDITQVTLD